MVTAAYRSHCTDPGQLYHDDFFFHRLNYLIHLPKPFYVAIISVTVTSKDSPRHVLPSPCFVEHTASSMFTSRKGSHRDRRSIGEECLLRCLPLGMFVSFKKNVKGLDFFKTKKSTKIGISRYRWLKESGWRYEEGIQC